MRKESFLHLPRRILGPVMAVGLAISCVAPEQPPAGPWESNVALSMDPEEGCSGRYSIKLNPGSLSTSIHDVKDLSKELKLQVDFNPRSSRSVNIVAQIIDTTRVRSGWVITLDDLLSKSHTLQTLWTNCKFGDALWDGQKLPKANLD